MLLSERHTIAGTGLQPGEGHTEGDAVSAPTLAVVHAHRLVWSVLWRRTPTVVPLGAQSKGTRQVISYDTASTDGIDHVISYDTASPDGIDPSYRQTTLCVSPLQVPRSGLNPSCRLEGENGPCT